MEEKKVGLSLRAVSGHEASRAEVQDYKAEARGDRGERGDRGGSHKAPASSGTTTLGDLINWKSER